MSKYTIENNISFYDELFKSLDDDSDDEDVSNTKCQITGTVLDDKFVALECNHKFNYNALFTEIYKQRFVFKTYDYATLSKNHKQKCNEANIDYFIRCPYCRNIQFTILPYYEELGLEKIYGINSLDPTLSTKTNNKYGNSQHSNNYNNYTLMLYGTQFKVGQCKIEWCPNKFVGCIPETTLSYCKMHYKSGLNTYKKEKKEKATEEKKKEKADVLAERQKLFDEKNKERLEKGLPLLKRLPSIKCKNNENNYNDKSENIVLNAQPISEYVPETDVSNNNNVVNKICCTAVLKTGVNKGKVCGTFKINESGYCARHHKK